MMHEMWQGGGWHMWLAGIFFVALIVLAIVILTRGGARRTPTRTEKREESPLDILKKRYARGEIDEEEFEEKRRRLEE